MSSEVSKQVRLGICDLKISELTQQSFYQSLDKIIGEKSKDDAMSTKAVANMRKIEEQLSIARAIRTEVEAEKE